MDLRGLKIFIEVAELKSFTRAAERLGYSQPTISFQIRQLEQELGVPLFDRIGHTVSLTDAGRDALRYAQRICNLAEEMTLDAKLSRETTGEVRIGMADSLCSPLIARGFGEFRAKYPGISLNVFAAGTGELFRMLDHNEVDMICTMDSHVYDSAYIIASEETIGAHFVVSSRSDLAKQEAVSIGELVRQPFLLTEKGMSYRRMMDEKLADRALEVRPVLETARADLICGLVEENMGVSFLPDYVTEDSLRAGRLKRLHVEGFQVTVWKQLLYRREKWVSPPMKALIGHLAELSLKREATCILPREPL